MGWEGCVKERLSKRETETDRGSSMEGCHVMGPTQPPKHADSTDWCGRDTEPHKRIHTETLCVSAELCARHEALWSHHYHRNETYWHESRCLISLLQGVHCAAVSDLIPALLPAPFDRVRGHGWNGYLQLTWPVTVFLSAFKKLLSLLRCQRASSEVIQLQEDVTTTQNCVEIWGCGRFFFSTRKPDCSNLAANRPCIKQNKSTKSILQRLQLFMNSRFEAFCLQKHKKTNHLVLCH